MDTLVSIENIINEILLSNSVDEKRLKKNHLIAFLKQADLVKSMPIAVRLNTELAIKEAIDSFMIHDNSASRQNLNNTYEHFRGLLKSNLTAA